LNIPGGTVNANHTHRHDEPDVPSTAAKPAPGADHTRHTAHAQQIEHPETTDHPGSGAYVVHNDHTNGKDLVEPVAMDSHSGHVAPAGQGEHGEHGAHVDHSGHEQVFRQRFWVCLALTVPVLLYSPMIQELFGFEMPQFPGCEWVAPLFAFVIFLYCCILFL
jgi:Cu2+-exporting ATPase